MLNEFLSPEHQVVHLRKRFPANTDDSASIAQLAGEKGWAIITAEIRGKNPHEIYALKQSGHTVFLLESGWMKLDFWEQARRLAKCFSQIAKEAEQAEGGTLFFVSIRGKIRK